MRLLCLALAGFALIAASPAEEAEKLIDQGRGNEAVALLEKAAATGDAEAIDSLGLMYDEGVVVGQDLARAALLYRQAGEAGNTHSQWRLGVMLDSSEGVKENSKEAVAWFRKAASKGDRSAIASLAVMYAAGRGVKRDFAESRKLYLEAGRRGEPHGFFGIAVLHSLGQGVPKDPVESLAWMMLAASHGDRQAKKAIEQYGLPSAKMKAASDRANVIAKELGYPNYKFNFRDLDAEKKAAKSH